MTANTLITAENQQKVRKSTKKVYSGLDTCVFHTLLGSPCWNGIKQFPRTLPLLLWNKSQTCARPQVLRKKIQHAMQTTD